MDSDEEVRSERRLALEEEMGKLRCGSASPSALSTASSGSPLVRGAGSGKRPAPTSIAAAQLQCQQQRLELAQRPAAAAAKLRDAAQSQPEAAKGLGYKLGKSVAYRAYRFNEFWSVNKLRYMNLACLLMTLICLAAILLLAGNNGARAPARRPPADELGEGQPGASQPLVARQEPGERAEKDYADLERAEAAESPAAGRAREPKLRRKTGAEPSELERERELDEPADPFNRLEALVDPIVSQLFDVELGGLGSLLRQRANMSRPLIRRTKNGATITISSSSVGPGSNSSDASPLPSLLERLLRPAGLRGAGDALNASNVAATATITIGAEPLLASPALRLSALSPLEALFGPPLLAPPPMSRHRRLFVPQQLGAASSGPLGAHGVWGLAPPPDLLAMMVRAQQDQQDQQEEPQFARSSLAGPPGLFEWGAREWAPAGNKSEESQPTSQPAPSNSTKSAGGEQQEGELELAAAPAASRRLQSLYSRPRLGPSNGGAMLIFSSGPMDAGELPPFAGPLAGFLPPPPPPPMLMGGEGARHGDGLVSPLVRSLLGSVMGDLAEPGNAPATAGHANKSAANSAAGRADDRQPRASARAPAWMAPAHGPSDPDDDWAPLSGEPGAWDEREQTGKQLRAKHRSHQDDELDEAPASLLAGLQLGESSQPITSRHFRPVPAGAKSQSLSRADDEADEPAGPSRQFRRAPVGRIAAFLRAPQNDRRLDDDSASPSTEMAPFGFIGKLLADLTSSGHLQASARARSLDLDDLDEGDSAQSEQSQELRPLRLASARIRMLRPTAMSHADEPVPLQPAHFGVSPESGLAEDSSREEQQAPGRLDESAMSSTENRIRLTLNQIYQQSPEPNQLQQQQQQRAFVLGPMPRGANVPIPLVQQQVKKGEPAKDGNPFTSPSSPLFGFPANSQPATMTQPPPPSASVSVGESQRATAATAKLAAAPTPAQNQQAPGASRQQRSFTYHSNNEIAAPFHSASQQKQPASQPQPNHQQQAESQARSRFVAPPQPQQSSFVGPAVGAAGIMGRRLDDLNEAIVHPNGRAYY